MLRERASLQPNETAFTYVDYDQDWKGVPLTLSWSQLYRRVVNLGEQLKLRGSTGDRALILAPQGLDYIVSFLGALQAGLVAVPLPLPNSRANHERIISVLADASPSVVLTTSAVIDNVSASLQPHQGQFAPAIIEVDLLDLDFRRRAPGPRARAGANDRADFIYLQYTSGSTQTSAGVMVSNKNVFANFKQIMADFFAPEGGFPPGTSRWYPGCRSTTIWVSKWGSSCRSWRARRRCSPAQWDFCGDLPAGCNCWGATVARFRRDRISPSSSRCARRPMTTWLGLISGASTRFSTAANGCSPRRSSNSPTGSRPSISTPGHCGRHMAWRKQQFT